MNHKKQGWLRVEKINTDYRQRKFSKMLFFLKKKIYGGVVASVLCRKEHATELLEMSDCYYSHVIVVALPRSLYSLILLSCSCSISAQ